MSKEIAYKYNDANESIGFLLWQLHMLWQRDVKTELDRLDLTHTQFVLLSVLAWLSKTQKIVTQTDIALHSKTDRMMVSKVLRTLEDKRMITRSNNKKDTRIKMISLTEQGAEVLQQAVHVVERVDDDFFSVDSHNLNQLITDFNHIIDRNRTKSGR
ncbi:MAG TPA: MarR family transcriptional regulator [Bacteroides reticulotermitis]|nr:MarR family transcriptional regulator [Bacteroides reticulotermitis]